MISSTSDAKRLAPAATLDPMRLDLSGEPKKSELMGERKSCRI
jgi:hypothetical protein